LTPCATANIWWFTTQSKPWRISPCCARACGIFPWDTSGTRQSFPPADCEILAGLSDLRAIDLTVAAPLASLDFAKNLRYINILYPQRAFLDPANNLNELLLHGTQVTEALRGDTREYLRVVDGEQAFELLCTASIDPADEFFPFTVEATRVFVSAQTPDGYTLRHTLDVPNRTTTASGGLLIADVDFDGAPDILVLDGGLGGMQVLLQYSCFLYRNGAYAFNASFGEIPNPSLDVENRKVLGTTRNWADSHSWFMYALIDGAYTMTDCLTIGLEHGASDGVVHYKTGKRMDGIMQPLEAYRTDKVPQEALEALFFDPGTYWALGARKWRTIDRYNRDDLADSNDDYRGPFNAQVAAIIAD